MFKNAVYQVEIIFEPTGDFLDFEYEYEVEDEEEAQDYLNGRIYEDILSNISIVPFLKRIED